jgi:hemolysin III
MGWLILAAINPLYMNHLQEGLYWRVAGGVFYTAGVAFFVMDSRVPYAHFVWHLFVMSGTVCHYIAVLAYAH